MNCPLGYKPTDSQYINGTNRVRFHRELCCNCANLSECPVRQQKIFLVRNLRKKSPTFNRESKEKMSIFEFPSHRVFRNETVLKLTPMEFRLFLFLVRHRGEVFSRQQLLEKVWDYVYAGNTRTVDFHILSLRRKIEDDPCRPVHLVTVHCLGYKFEG